jgi:hypothetical protein
MLVVGQNSWVTIAEADTYISNKINSGSWSTVDKAKYLITAFFAIFTSPDLSISKNETNEKVKLAQIELAFWYIDNYNSWMKRQSIQSMGVTSFSVDSIHESYNNKGSLPLYILDMLSDYKTGSTIATFDRDVEYYR